MTYEREIMIGKGGTLRKQSMIAEGEIIMIADGDSRI